MIGSWFSYAQSITYMTKAVIRRPTILHIFSSFDVGGAQKRVTRIADACCSDFRHVVFALDGNYGACSLLKNPAAIERLGVVSGRGSFPERLLRYQATIRRFRPDLLATYNWGSIEWALATWLAPVPHIHVEDGFGPDEIDRQLLRRVWIRRVALAKSFKVIVPSRTLECVSRKVWRLPSRRILYIPNGAAPLTEKASDKARQASRQEIGVPEDVPVIGWIGAFRREKNVGRLMRAFAVVSENAVLVLVGDGRDRESIEAIARDLGIGGRVRMLGSRVDIESLLPLFDVLALSSDTEQMPVAVLEGMAAGLPIASVDVGDVRIMVAPENLPYIVERSDHALAEALAKLLESSALRRQIGQANLRAVQCRFSAARMIETYVSIFSEAVCSLPSSESQHRQTNLDMQSQRSSH